MKKQWLVLVIVLLAPAIAMPLFGNQIDAWVDQLKDSRWAENPVYVSLAIIGILASDLFLPIPSSVVNTWAGSVLGIGIGTLVCWLGLNLGAWVGYLVGWYFGYSAARRFSDKRSLRDSEQWIEKSGMFTLLILRAIPVLAEASVLVAGTYRLNPLKFWLPVLIANLLLAIAYATLGYLAYENEWFLYAIYFSIAIPLSILLLWRIKASSNARATERSERAFVQSSDD